MYIQKKWKISKQICEIDLISLLKKISVQQKKKRFFMKITHTFKIGELEESESKVEHVEDSDMLLTLSSFKRFEDEDLEFVDGFRALKGIDGKVENFVRSERLFFLPRLFLIRFSKPAKEV